MTDALEFEALRAEGLRQLERLAGSAWTDFNTHDPGITILEQACYALSDLGYRISHDMPDLLASGALDSSAGLYPASRILTGNPVTLDDLRRLALDVDGVKNAWIEPIAEPEPALHHHPGKRELLLRPEGRSTEAVRPQGLFRVLIEKSDLADISGSVVRREVARRLHAHRNLCEDFASVVVLEPQDVALTASIEIGPTEDAAGLLVDVLEALADYVAPSVRFQSLEQMLAAGHPLDEIFEGPALVHGFIDDATLKQLRRRTAIHTSDLIRAFMSVQGVRAVRNLEVSSDAARSPWILELDPGRAPRLDLVRTKITLERAQLAVPVDAADVERRYLQRRTASPGLGTWSPEDLERPVPRGRARRVADYRSMLHHFPDNYGVGAAGLLTDAPPARRAQAKQLRAYLLFFDQLLANQFAQLAHAQDLFCFDHESSRSYFARAVQAPELGLDEVRRDPESHAERLQELTEDARAGGGQRRTNRFLTHLLARFAEELTDHSLTGVTESVDERRIAQKRSFLRRYPELGARRGSGFDYLRGGPGAATSGLEQRIRHKLGLAEEDEAFLVVEHILLLPMREDVAPAEHEGLRQVPLLSAAKSADPYSLQLTFVFPDWPQRFATPGFWALVERTLAEETPVHLTPYLVRLDRKAMGHLRDSYQAWIERRRNYWTRALGL